MWRSRLNGAPQRKTLERRPFFERLETRELLSVYGDLSSHMLDEHTGGTGSAHVPGHVGDSPFAPPKATDLMFVVDEASGLDTDCSFRSDGPLVFNIQIDRYFGFRGALLDQNLIDPFALLRTPAYDVDYHTSANSAAAPERDRVTFNGRVVPREYLFGYNGRWVMNTFYIPIEWINFPDDPGEGGILQPKSNQVAIYIDTANRNDDVWCTAIDWASLEFRRAPSPALLVHGIFSSGSLWSDLWMPRVNLELGIPAATVNLGALNSVDQNAVAIANKINELKQRWGVDHLNIVAHSKGGIDSREYITRYNGNDIGRLIQIGTPNAGSPLADFVQLAISSAVGDIPTAILNTFLPAGINLTTYFMQEYNRTRGFNPSTQYVSLAGNYDAPFWDPLHFFGSIVIPGEDDGIVPVSSVHALSYARHMQYPLGGATTDPQAKHTGQAHSIDIYNTLIPFLKAPIPLTSRSSRGTAVEEVLSMGWGANSNPSAPLRQNTGILADAIQVGQVVSHQILIDGDQATTVTLHYGMGDIDFTLISPSGREINPAVAELDPGIGFGAAESIDGFKTEFYHFEQPEPGEWTAIVNGVSVSNPTGAEPYFVTGWLSDSAIRLNASSDRSAYSPGDGIMIQASVDNNGTPITGASVEVKVVLPDVTVVYATLVDDGTNDDALAGDGIYSGRYTAPSLEGVYRFVVSAEGQMPIAFRREAFLVTAVSSSSASRITGTFSDLAIDNDEDGFFDELAIDVEVEIADSRRYTLIGELSDSAGNLVGIVNAAQDMNPGLHTMQLLFDASTIFENGVDGPFTLRAVRLIAESAESLIAVDELFDAYTTSAYSHNSFERPAIVVVRMVDNFGIDENENGQYDRLEVHLEVDLLQEGFYEWTASLFDQNGNRIGSAVNEAELEAGVTTISLSFDGPTIAWSGIDGPYVVGDVLIVGSDASAIVPQVFETDAFVASEFERPALATITSTDPSQGSQNRPLSEISMVFSQSMHPATVFNLTNYDVRTAGSDGQFATGDDISVPFVVNYDAPTNTARLLPAGPLVQVNDPARPANANTDVATDGDGNYVVVWANQEGGIQARLFAADGTPMGGQITVTSDPFADDAVVAGNADGSFVVVWWRQSYDPDTFEYLPEVRARLFSAGGTPLGDEFIVATGSSGSEISVDVYGPDVAMDASGNFVIAWTESAWNSVTSQSQQTVKSQLFDPLGEAQTQINVVTSGENSWLSPPAVAITPAGSFAVLWQWSFSDPETFEYSERLQARLFSGDGMALTDVFMVGSEAEYAFDPAVAMDSAGNLVIVWDAGDDVLVQLFHADGTPRGNEFSVSAVSWPATDFDNPGVAMDASGNFVIAWIQNEQHVLARRFVADGTPQGGETSFRPLESDDELDGRMGVGLRANGDFVLTWAGEDSLAIFARHFFADAQFPPGYYQSILSGTDWPSLLNEAGYLLDGDSDGLPGGDYVFAFEIVAPTPLPGDYNENGVVDAADYVVWRKTVGMSVTPFSGADGDGDGVVEQDDYGVWRANFGRTMAAGGGGELRIAAFGFRIDQSGEGGAANSPFSRDPQGSAEDGSPQAVVPISTAGQASSGTRAISTAGQASSGTRAEPRRVSTGDRLQFDDALVAWAMSRSGREGGLGEDVVGSLTRGESPQDSHNTQFDVLDEMFAVWPRLQIDFGELSRAANCKMQIEN